MHFIPVGAVEAEDPQVAVFRGCTGASPAEPVRPAPPRPAEPVPACSALSFPIGLPPLPCAQSQRSAPNLNRCYRLNLEGAAAAFRARAANAGHLRDASGQGQRATGEGEGGRSGDWGHGGGGGGPED